MNNLTLRNVQYTYCSVYALQSTSKKVCSARDPLEELPLCGAMIIVCIIKLKCLVLILMAAVLRFNDISYHTPMFHYLLLYLPRYANSIEYKTQVSQCLDHVDHPMGSYDGTDVIIWGEASFSIRC